MDGIGKSLPLELCSHDDILFVIAEMFAKKVNASHVFGVFFYSDFEGDIIPFCYAKGFQI